MSGWIGVDLDGTLAIYPSDREHSHIGSPIPKMVDRIKRWLADGIEVRIVTAQASLPGPRGAELIAAVEAWLKEAGLPRLKVTNAKDFGMVELWDDRAVQVIPNTGESAVAAYRRQGPPALSLDDVCRLSRVFNDGCELAAPQDRRINDWLKNAIANARMAERRSA